MGGKNEAGLPLAQWADLWIGWKEAWMSVESACQRLPTPPEIEAPGAEGAATSPSSQAPSTEAGTGHTEDDASATSSRSSSRRS